MTAAGPAMKVPGYEVRELLHDGPRTAVYRAVETNGGRAVVLKTHAGAYPSPEQLARLEHEYEIGRRLAGVEGAVRYLDCVRTGRSVTLVIEDSGGRALAERLGDGPLEVTEALRIARDVAAVLGRLHRAGVLHKDVTPGNVLVHPETGPEAGEVRLGDFGISSILVEEKQEAVNPNLLQGTLAYISPEQTGRMNRAIDHRSDLYSLGVTLYQMLTGSRPFAGADALEIVHGHVAKRPRPPHELRPEVPEAVSAIVLKLMAKAAEDRYQSAEGLEADLAECLRRLESTGTVEDLEIGGHDRSASFRISEKLYGRKDEVEALLAAYDRASRGRTEVVLVTGRSGIGKSMLVHETQRKLVETGGYFIAGKFDQLAMDRPLSAGAQALNDLVRQILTEPPEALQRWAERIHAAVGVNGQILIDWLPALEHVIGIQPAVADLPPLEAKKRFEETILRFFLAFCAPEHPVVFFLDDAQWIDPTSIEFFERTVLGDDRRHFLRIVSYRDNEVGPSHPLRLSLERLAEAGVPITTIELQPLSRDDQVDLLVDTLFCDRARAEPLAALLDEKTGGNPFFVNRFLKDLHERELIYTDPGDRSWRWHDARIRALAVSDNVVDLLVGKIQRYSPEAQEELRLASCLGGTFTLADLATIAGHSPLATAAFLAPIVQEGLLLPRGSAGQLYRMVPGESTIAHVGDASYAFAHDRIQEAAYSQIPEGERRAVHLRVGRLLLERIPPDQLAERIFEVIGHLDQGSPLVTDPAERLELARLYRTAGRRAIASTAYETAGRHLESGIAMLGDGAWEHHRDLALDLHLGLIECRFLLGDLERAEAIFRDVAGRAHSREHLGVLYQLMMRIRQTAKDDVGGIAIGREGLRRLDLGLPEDPADDERAVAEAQARVDAALARVDVPALVDSPAMTDRELGICLGVLHEVWSCALMVGDEVNRKLMALETIALSLEHGNSEFSACGYIGYAAELTAHGDYRRAYEVGRLAVDLAERFDNPLVIPKVNNTFANFINHYVNHLGSNVPIYERSYRAALQSGDHWWGAWAAGFIRQAKYLKGDPLSEVLEVGETYHGYIRESGYEPLDHLQRLDRQVVLNLLGERGSADGLDDDGGGGEDAAEGAAGFREADLEAALAGFGYGLSWLHLFRAGLLYLYGRYQAALAASERAWEHKDLIPGTMMYPDFFFYDTLIRAAAPGAADSLDRMRSNLERMELWAGVSDDPEQNHFRHRRDLMAAEIARVEGRGDDALELYERAIAAAAACGFTHHEAIAHERAATFHLERGRPKAALGYLIEARYLYEHWGAARKVELFDAAHREHLARVAAVDRGRPGDSSTITTTTLSAPGFDLSALLKSARILSQETDLATLLRTMLRIAIENAGARRGALLLQRGDELVVEAEGSAEETDAKVLHSLALSEAPDLPHTMLQYVARTNEELLVPDALKHESWGADPYVQSRRPRSVLCLPLLSRGVLVAILYMEHRQLVDAFTAERLAVLRLLASQAAISLESALLKASEESAPFEFQVGGSLVADSRSYVERQADRELYHSIQAGEFCFVLNSRQMGKSSLRVHTMHRLQREGVACVSIDITSIGSKNLTPEQWYAGIARALTAGLGLSREVDLRRWWRERDHLSPVQRLVELVTGEILSRVESKIVVFIDEIDSVLSLDFSLDDFFAAIRAFYNQRADDPRLERLVFVLLGVARPSELIQDKRRTPFNIGRGIPLYGFRLSEARPLLRGLQDKAADPEPVLKSVLSWTGGHPFLTQKVCRLAVQASSKPQPGREEEWVRTLVRQRVIENWEAQDEPEHLKTIRSRLLKDPDRARRYLELYREIYQRGSVPLDHGALQEELVLTGLVVREWDELRIANSIYRDVFNPRWVDATLEALGGPEPGEQMRSA